MIDFLPLHDRLLEVALQRNLAGFEQAMKKTLGLFGLSGWACIFPPSLQAGGRAMFVGHGVEAQNSRLLIKAFKTGAEAAFLHAETGAPLLAKLAQELAPSRSSRCRILRISRAKEIELVMICYRAQSDPEFDTVQVNLLMRVGRLLDRCFQVLAQDQQQEFLAGLFRMVGNLHPEGLCILDSKLRVIFENRRFREHMHLWNNGANALQNLSLPRSVELPEDWQRACEQSFQSFNRVEMPPTPGRMVVSQSAIMNLNRVVGDSAIDGAIRYVAFQTALGVRPYAMLTSSQREVAAAGPAPFAQIAEALGFSRREAELGEMILSGAPAQEIANQLKISLPTVKTHISNILRKAGVKTRLEFVGLCRNPNARIVSENGGSAA
jgi:DNA-binding CsgD family transcriptional regulator